MCWSSDFTGKSPAQLSGPIHCGEVFLLPSLQQERRFLSDRFLLQEKGRKEQGYRVPVARGAGQVSSTSFPGVAAPQRPEPLGLEPPPHVRVRRLPGNEATAEGVAWPLLTGEACPIRAWEKRSSRLLEKGSYSPKKLDSPS